LIKKEKNASQPSDFTNKNQDKILNHSDKSIKIKNEKSRIENKDI